MTAVREISLAWAPAAIRDALVAALREQYPARLWRVGGALHWLDDEGSLQKLTVEDLRALVPRAAVGRRKGKAKAVVVDVPERPINDVFNQRFTDDFPALAGVRRCPWVSAEGRLVVERGLDNASGLWLHWNGPTCDPYALSEADVDDVLRRLTDFEFVSAADRVNALAMYVQAVRSLVGSPSPLALILGNEAEVAKSYLARLLGIVVLGTKHPTSAPLPENRTELHYSLNAYVQAGDPFLWLDNAATGSGLGGPVLHQLLTASGPVRSRRIRSSDLGGGDPTRMQWVVTGNQLDPDPEAARRVLPVRLQPRAAGRPFLTPDLTSWVHENRALVVSALLRVVVDWHGRGEPAAPRVLPSFETWSRLVGGPVGLLDEGAALLSTRITSAVEVELAQLFDAWPRAAGGERMSLPASYVLSLVDKMELPALSAEAGSGAERARQTRFGSFLGALSRRSRPIGGWLLQRKQQRAGPTYRPENGDGDPQDLQDLHPEGPYAKGSLHGRSAGPAGPAGPQTPISGTREGTRSREGGGTRPAGPAGPADQQETPTIVAGPGGGHVLQELQVPHDDPARAAVVRMAERGVRVDPEVWLARCAEAEAALVLDESDEARDRLRNLRSYSRQVYGQATTGRVTCGWELQGPGRIGTTRPALQQVTKAYGLREAVVPEPGAVFVHGDWSTAHVWIAAGLSGDRSLLDHAIGGDLYERAAGVFAPELDGQAARDVAKVCVLSTLNGAGGGLAETLAEHGVRVTAREAKARRDRWLRSYPLLQYWLTRVASRQEWTSPLGRPVVLPSDRDPYAAVGWTMQAVEADALRLVLNGIGWPVVLTVHDEVLLEVPLAEAPAAATDLRAAMDEALIEVAELPRNAGITSARVGIRPTWARPTTT